jgi:hypothetical protein
MAAIDALEQGDDGPIRKLGEIDELEEERRDRLPR